MHDISKNLKKLRLQRNWTQQQMADMLFVTRQAVSNWETGKSMPDLAILENIAQKLEKEKIKTHVNKIKKLLVTAVAFYILAVPLMVGTFIYDLPADIFLMGSLIYMLCARPLMAHAVGIFAFYVLKHNGKINRNISLPYSQYIGHITKGVFIFNYIILLYFIVDALMYMGKTSVTVPSITTPFVSVATGWLIFMTKGFGLFALLRFFALGLVCGWSHIDEKAA